MDIGGPKPRHTIAMSSTASWPGNDDVRVFVADVRAFGADDRAARTSLVWMTPAERARFDRFRHDEDRLMFALGRLMARTLVGRALGVDPADWAWREGPHGRPEIDRPGNDLHFNLSHSAGLVICALARGRAVGVDVEDLERRAPEWALVERYCSPAEADDIRSCGDRWRDAVPHLLDAERGVPQSARARHFRAARRHLLQHRRARRADRLRAVARRQRRAAGRSTCGSPARIIWPPWPPGRKMASRRRSR